MNLGPLVEPLGASLPVLSYGLGGWRFLGVPTEDPLFVLAVILGFNGPLRIPWA
ncbi:MAG TPA: hypothetical protein VGK73_15125 [Polyangiaceae bacterium]